MNAFHRRRRRIALLLASAVAAVGSLWAPDASAQVAVSTAADPGPVVPQPPPWRELHPEPFPAAPRAANAVDETGPSRSPDDSDLAPEARRPRRGRAEARRRERSADAWVYRPPFDESEERTPEDREAEEAPPPPPAPKRRLIPLPSIHPYWDPEAVEYPYVPGGGGRVYSLQAGDVIVISNTRRSRRIFFLGQAEPWDEPRWYGGERGRYRRR